MQLKEKGIAILRMVVVLLSLFVPAGLIIEMIYRFFATPPSPQEPVGMMITAIVSSLIVLLIGFILSKTYKIHMRELGMLFTKHWLRHYSIGIGLGIVTIVLIWSLTVVFGGFRISVNNMNQRVLTLILMNFITMLFVGYYEESLVRGLMTFVGAKNSKLFNAIVSAIVFSLLHLVNNSYSIMSMINTCLIAIVFSMLTWISGDLWVPIGYHAFWNFVMGSILGVQVSGVDMSGLLISSPNNAGLINGGGYGLEGSLICTVIILAQIAFLYVFFIKKGKINKEPVAYWLA